MKWITEKEVQDAAEKSKRAAIASCKKHWKQNAEATEEEAITQGDIMSKWYLCALCIRYDDNCDRGCPLNSPRSNYCCKEYAAADRALENWTDGHGRFSTWQKKAKLMYERLCEL